MRSYKESAVVTRHILSTHRPFSLCRHKLSPPLHYRLAKYAPQSFQLSYESASITASALREPLRASEGQNINDVLTEQYPKVLSFFNELL